MEIYTLSFRKNLSVEHGFDVHIYFEVNEDGEKKPILSTHSSTDSFKNITQKELLLRMIETMKNAAIHNYDENLKKIKTTNLNKRKNNEN